MRRRDLLCTTLAFVRPSLATTPARRAELPFRQVHLDFHNSELIPDIAADFDPAQFVRTLQAAHVDSINIFAKCHHGCAYYDTKVGFKHPHLQRDLLGDMVTALKPAGIAVNYYYSLVWDVHQSRIHPAWRNLDQHGEPIEGVPGVSWPWLCLNSPYLDQVLAENKEILSKYPTDGAWFDILKQPAGGCFCRWCRADRDRLHLRDTPDDLYRHNKIVAKRVEQRLTDLVHAQLPEALTFYNSRLVIGVRDELPYYSHIEIESLPTGGWGYSHFQQRVRYMRTLGKDLVGMTGRFHKSWGDFGGLKNQAALDFECLNFLANGTKVCVGDQLHPRGVLDLVTYARIGRTYEKVAALEPYARGTHALADIGVLSVASTNPDQTTQKLPLVDQGFTNMLVELHHQFDVLDTASDFSAYKLVIVPDEIRPVPGLVDKLSRYVANGGALLLSHESLLANGHFALPGIGVRYLGPAKFKDEYLLIRPASFPQIDDTPYFLYQPGTAIAAEDGTEVLATYGHPYFDRTPEHYSSHKQTPLGQRTDEPLITRRGRIVYIANPFFRSYAQDAFGVQKQVVRSLIAQLLPDPLLRAPNLPSTAQATVLAQPAERRTVVHLLHYPLTRRAPDIDIIEEPGILENVQIALRLPQKPSTVTLVPEGRSIPCTYNNGYASCTIPRIVGHQAIAFS